MRCPPGQRILRLRAVFATHHPKIPTKKAPIGAPRYSDQFVTAKPSGSDQRQSFNPGSYLLCAGFPVEFLHIRRISGILREVKGQSPNFTDILFFCHQLTEFAD
jgi:hypothetical protein